MVEKWRLFMKMGRVMEENNNDSASTGAPSEEKTEETPEGGEKTE